VLRARRPERDLARLPEPVAAGVVRRVGEGRAAVARRRSTKIDLFLLVDSDRSVTWFGDAHAEEIYLSFLL
jgi:hypothetical protein